MKATINVGIVYGNSGSACDLRGYTDAEFAGCLDTRRSTTGVVFTLSGGAILWSSQKQSVVALSTTEAEYIALTMGARDAIWLRQMMCELGFKRKCVQMYVDNQFAIKLTTKLEFHKKTRHIDIRFHSVRDNFEKGEIDVEYVETKQQLADMFTKPLSRQLLRYLVDKIGMRNGTISGSVEIL